MSLDNLTPSEFSKWYLLGQAVRRMMGKGEATMYSYNGVVLPKLPDSEYKYAVLQAQDENYPGGTLYLLNFFSTPCLVDNGSLSPSTKPYTVAYTHASPYYDYESWGKFTTTTSSATVWSSYPIVWTNTDLRNKDGSVYLKATDPVPVYE